MNKTLSKFIKQILNEKTINLIIAVYFFLLIPYPLSLTPNVYADFDDLGAGARAIAMGNAFTAIADDAFGFYYNPAGPALLRRGQVGADYGKLWLGLDDGSDLSVAFGSIAMPMIRARKAEVKKSTSTKKINLAEAAKFRTETVNKGTILFAWRYFSLQQYYTEAAYYIGFSKPVKEKWAWGFNLKILQEKYVIDDYLIRSPVFEYGAKDSVQNFSLDIGGLYNIAPRFFLGMSISDINQPDMGLQAAAPIPATIRLGLGWRRKDLKWAADIVGKDSLWYGSFGLEKWFKNLIAVRGGLTIGGLNFINLGSGFSVNIGDAQIDYVFQYPLSGIKDVSGTHRMSLVYRFGTPPKDELATGSLEYYYAELQDKNMSLQANLEATEAEKKNLEQILLEEATIRIKERIRAAKREAKLSKKTSRRKQKELTEIKHVIKRGDTLQSLARRYYGDSKYWNEIYQVNKNKIGRGGALKRGQVLIIPLHSHLKKIAEEEKKRDGKRGVSPVKVIKPGTPSKSTLPGMGPVKVISPKKINVSKPKTKKPKTKSKPKVKRPKKHVVQPGENLRTIAEKYYKDSSKWRDIYKANRSKVIGGQVMPGQEIKLP